MPYTTGSQGAQTNCASVFMTTLDPLLVAAGFTFVEQTVVSTITSRVYKSPAASNFFGSDWFLIMRRSSDTATGVSFAVCELYNSTTHICTNYAPSTTTGLVPTASFAINDPGGKTPDSTSLRLNTINISASTFTYFLSLTANRIVIGTRVGANDEAVYVGLYDDLQAAAISPFPLIGTMLTIVTSGGSVGGAATREPNTTIANNGNFQWNNLVDQYLPWTALSAADLYTGKILLSRARVPARTVNHLRGLFRDLWASNVTGANGDTITATISGVSKTLVQVRGGTVSTGVFVDTSI